MLPNAQIAATHEAGVCIVRGTIDRRVGFELRLPDGWNGRYYQIGTGGFAGTIFPDSLAWEAAKGNAAAMTDAGHKGDPMDARWAEDNPEAVIDYGWRAIKLTSDAASALIRSYYGRASAHRYFAGCSNGGRQALMAGQRWPADWDGIVAGAPANLWTRQFATFASLQQQLAGIPLDLAAIRRDALAACPKGTVSGGVALAPMRCHYKPSDSRVAAIAAAGYEPTSADPEWAHWIVNPDPEAPSQRRFAEQSWRRLLGKGAGWTIADYRPGDTADPGLGETLDSDRSLEPFRKRGGKIISYFGWGDAVIAPRPHLAWYRSLPDTAPYYRLFMVPGMAHCQGGDVPDAFGQSPVSPALSDDPRHDIRRAIEAWVEQGRVPTTIAAVQRDSNGAVIARRTLNPF